MRRRSHNVNSTVGVSSSSVHYCSCTMLLVTTDWSLVLAAVSHPCIAGLKPRNVARTLDSSETSTSPFPLSEFVEISEGIGIFLEF